MSHTSKGIGLQSICNPTRATDENRKALGGKACMNPPRHPNDMWLGAGRSPGKHICRQIALVFARVDKRKPWAKKEVGRWVEVPLVC